MATTVKYRIGGCGRVSGDTDDDTSGSLSSDWGEYGKTCVWMTQAGKVVYRPTMEESADDACAGRSPLGRASILSGHQQRVECAHQQTSGTTQTRTV